MMLSSINYIGVRLICCFPTSLSFWQIVEVARPIILDWIIAQHSRILEWTGRAFDLEVRISPEVNTDI